MFLRTLGSLNRFLKLLGRQKKYQAGCPVSYSNIIAGNCLQVTQVFSVGLLDHYGHVSNATSGGACSISSPSTDILLTEAGRTVAIQNGVSTFSQFDVTGEHPLTCALRV